MTFPVKPLQPPRPSFNDALALDLERIQNRGLRRFLRRIESAQDSQVTINGREYLLFCSNNYLGLASHPEVIEAAVRATRDFGASAVSSRLISGNMEVHEQLEETIAEWKDCEAALAFSTGYQANIGAITSLLQAGDLVLSDELNHASIIDGCRLARAEVGIYRHNDVDHLAELLEQHSGAGRILIVTESVFSMDGDKAPLAAIADLGSKHGAWLMVDEAHAAGVFGPGGAGLVAELGLNDHVDVHIGTLGKALASFGAYVAGSRTLMDTLINRARSFIFTTGLPPAAAAAAKASVEILRREPERAQFLLAKSHRLGMRLREHGLNVPHVDSQILPVLIGQADHAVEAAQQLLERGIYVAAIRPPTVPEGSSRLRVSLMATHSDEQIATLADGLIASIVAQDKT